MEPVARVTVTVTFLADGPAAAGPSPGLPTEYQVVTVQSPTVGFYRYLYDTVGADYVWWLRRTMPDQELAMLLRDPAVSIHVLYSGGQPAGFFELDGRGWPDVNLSYFGLMPHAIGAGVGYPFLRSAVDAVWRQEPARHDGEHLHGRSSARAAHLSARRLPHAASGARGMERAAAAGHADSGTIADVRPMMRGHRAL